MGLRIFGSTPFAVCASNRIREYSAQQGKTANQLTSDYTRSVDATVILVARRTLRASAEEVSMRNIGIALAAIVIAVVLGSFAPITWSTAPTSLSAAG
jgi:hypothetical protein